MAVGLCGKIGQVVHHPVMGEHRTGPEVAQTHLLLMVDSHALVQTQKSETAQKHPVEVGFR